MATVEKRLAFIQQGIQLVLDTANSPNVMKDEAVKSFSTLVDGLSQAGLSQAGLSQAGGKKKGRKGVKHGGGAEPSLLTGSPVYNLTGLNMSSGSVAAVPTSPFVNAPQPFSAGMPIYGSAEHGFNADVTNITSGGLLQGGGKKKGKRVSRKKA
jgi:hypothetical protein